MSGALSVTPPTPPQTLADVYNAAGKAWGVAPSLLYAIGNVESGNSLTPVTSSAGALGTQQFIPSTASAEGMTDPQSPVQSIWASAKLMHQNLKQFGGDTVKALMAYNGGTDPTKWGPEEQSYVAKVTKAQQALLATALAVDAAKGNPQPMSPSPQPQAPSILSMLPPQGPDETGGGTSASTSGSPSGSPPSIMSALPSNDSDDPNLVADASSAGADANVDMTDPGIRADLEAGARQTEIDMLALPDRLVAKGADLLRAKLGLKPIDEAGGVERYFNGIRSQISPGAATSPLTKIVHTVGDVAPAFAGGMGAEGLLDAGANLAGRLPLVGDGARAVMQLASRAAPKYVGTGQKIVNTVLRGGVQGAGSALGVQGTAPVTPTEVAENTAAGAMANPILHGIVAGGKAIATPIIGGVVRSVTKGNGELPDLLNVPRGKANLFSPAIATPTHVLAHTAAPLWETLQAIDSSGSPAVSRMLNFVKGKLAEVGLTPAEALAHVQKYGAHGTLADLPQSKLQKLSQDIASTPGPGRDITRQVMGGEQLPGGTPGGRADTIHTEAEDAIRKALKVPGNAHADVLGYVADNNAAAQKLYSEAKGQGSDNLVPTPPVIAQMVKHNNPEIIPLLVKHLQNGLEKAENDFRAGRGEEPDPRAYQLMKSPDPTTVVANSKLEPHYENNFTGWPGERGQFATPNQVPQGKFVRTVTARDGTPLQMFEDNEKGNGKNATLSLWAKGSDLPGTPTKQQGNLYAIGHLQTNGAGNVDHVLVRPQMQRQGLGTLLANTAAKRFGVDVVNAKDITQEGEAFINDRLAKQAAAAPKVLNEDLPVRSLINLKQTLDQIGEGTFKGSPGNLSSLGELAGKSENEPGYRQDLGNYLKGVSPEYAKGTELIGDAKQAEEAFKLGHSFPTAQAQDIRTFVKGDATKPPATAHQKQWLAAGAVHRAVTDIQKKAQTGQPIDGLLRKYLNSDSFKEIAGHHMISGPVAAKARVTGALAANGMKLFGASMKPSMENPDLASEIAHGMWNSAVSANPIHAVGALARLSRAWHGQQTPAEQAALASLWMNPDKQGLARLFAEHEVRSQPNVAKRVLGVVGQHAAVALPTALAAGGNRPQPNALAPLFQQNSQRGQEGQ